VTVLIAELRSFSSGELAEWLKAIDSKSIVGVSLPGVRIPRSPLTDSDDIFGVVTEWPMVLAWKASVGQPTAGSNPAYSVLYNSSPNW
jgi:hypothetical protein